MSRDSGKLYNSVEAHIRGLRAIGILVSAYGSMLSSILVNKLPPEIRLIISCEIARNSWDLDKGMSIIEQEVDARERASVPTIRASPTGFKPQRQTSTAATLVTSNSEPTGDQVVRFYCG